MAVGAVTALSWAVLFLIFAPAWSGVGILGNLLMLLLPLAGIGGAVLIVLTLLQLQQEAAQLRRDLDRPRTEGTGPPPPPVPPTEPMRTMPSPGPERAAPRPVPAPPAPTTAQQPQLPLDKAPVPPLSLVDLVRALHFPETQDDAEGFRSLKRALRDHKSAQVVRAAQDMLTLLSQDGVYMDDLAHERPEPTLWRRFARGERGAAVARVGTVTDDRALALCADRMRDNTVFRDAAHHFLRRFDHMLGALEPQADDLALEALAATRSGLAFMLVGQVAGIFGKSA